MLRSTRQRSVVALFDRSCDVSGTALAPRGDPDGTAPHQALCKDLLGSPIHALASPAEDRGRLKNLQFVSGEADGVFHIRPFNVWEKSALVVDRERLVSFIDRPGSKISHKPQRRRLEFFRLRLRSVGSGEFGTAPCGDHLGISPTGVED